MKIKINYFQPTHKPVYNLYIFLYFKIENPERPNKAIVYPFALLFLLVFGYLNYRNKSSPAT